MIAKYIILSNRSSVASDNTLHICIKEPLLILKRFIVLLHPLSAYNSLLVRYKVYSSIPGNVCVQNKGTVESRDVKNTSEKYLHVLLKK